MVFLLSEEELNSRPIIGILAQELPGFLEDAYQGYNYTSYIGAAYVKYVESAGARVVPVLIGQVLTYSQLDDLLPIGATPLCYFRKENDVAELSNS